MKTVFGDKSIDLLSSLFNQTDCEKNRIKNYLSFY